MTSPLLTSSAAKSEVVPWRVSSCVRRSGCPGRIGSSGCVRSRAWIWDFSSTHSTNARSGGSRYRPRCRGPFDEQRIRRELECLRAVRLQPEGAPDARHRALTQPAARRHAARTPVGRVAWLRFQRQPHHVLHRRITHRARGAGARLIQQWARAWTGVSRRAGFSRVSANYSHRSGAPVRPGDPEGRIAPPARRSEVGPASQCHPDDATHLDVGRPWLRAGTACPSGSSPRRVGQEIRRAVATASGSRRRSAAA